jgi:hypothetical protein
MRPWSNKTESSLEAIVNPTQCGAISVVSLLAPGRHRPSAPSSAWSAKRMSVHECPADEIVYDFTTELP